MPVDTSEDALQPVLARFRGEIDQLPPMHSALRAGRRAAPAGPQRPDRGPCGAPGTDPWRWKAPGFGPPHVEIRVRCQGTYIRTLAEDIGAALGTGAHLSALEAHRPAGSVSRTPAAWTLRASGATGSPAPPAARRAPPGPARAELDAAAKARLRNGQVPRVSGLEGVHGVYGPGGAVIGLGSAETGGVLRALRLTQVTEKHVKSRA